MIPSNTSAADPLLYSFKDTDELAAKLADFVIKAQDEGIAKRDKFTLAISGGSLPKVLAKNLAGNDKAKWDKWEVFFADERLVNLDHADSNYKANKEELFDKVSIPPENIHTINENLMDEAQKVADDYEQQIISTFAMKNAVAFPRFDLILLGIGPDGHTCSLFPEHALINETSSWVACIEDSPKPPAERITFTYPVLNHAHKVAFVASGDSKKDVIADVLDHPEKNLPASGVKPVRDGQVFYFTDDAATSKVKYVKSEFKL